ncbi:TPA: 50S ribosomal protein L21e [Candidatus Woesearchaeota archaeon]|nr:50S ribosomal protein L21e [Candidatus Woesearchaeota archaeon]HII68739.1 50S ribosomal protein L21e [Candidatus Woesearchaeota archaeon]
MKHNSTIRRKTRGKYRKEIRSRGKISLTAYFQKLSAGDLVHLRVEPSVLCGLYHPRYVGKTGVVTGKRGECYEIAIHDQHKAKTLIVHPVHLKKA